VSVFDAVIALRRQGVKPRGVFVDLVAAKFREQPILTQGGVVTCQIPPSQSLSDLDCRPLVDLTVHVQDFTDSRERHLALARLVAQAEPALLVMPVHCDNGVLIVHRRYGGANPTTERVTL
jgi:hypothetical protein